MRKLKELRELHSMLGEGILNEVDIASNRRTRRKFSVYVQYIFRLCCCRKCMDDIERLVFTAAAAVIVDAAIASNFA